MILRNQRSKKVLKTGEYVDYWYRNYKMPKHQISTIAVQLNYINTHIKNSSLGRMNINSVRTADVQMLLKELLTNGNKCSLPSINRKGNPLAASTVQKIRALLISAFKQATKEHIVSYNYAADTESIPSTKKVHHFFCESEKKLFLKKTEKHRFSLAYKMLFLLGLRRGEILGLSWDDIDFKNKTLLIHQVLIAPNDVPFLKPSPKTDASLRIIPISSKLVSALTSYKKKQQEEKAFYGRLWKNYDNLVFVNKDGSYHSPKYFSKNIKNIIRNLGINPILHTHSIRHTFATDMLQLNTPLPDLKAIGGWSTTDTLMEIYAHTVQKSHRQAMNRIFEFYDKHI